MEPQPQITKTNDTKKIHLLRRKYIVLFSVCLLLVSIPLTVTVFRKNQANQSHANVTATLSLKASSDHVVVNTPFQLNVVVDPGQNLVSEISFQLQYDHSLFMLQSIQNNTAAFPVTLQNDVQTGAALFSIGADQTKAIHTQTTVATVTFQPIAPSTGTTITFNQTQSFAYALSASTQVNETVVKSFIPQSFVIENGSAQSLNPSCTPRPACLDATPACKIAITSDMCAATGSAALSGTELSLAVSLPGIGVESSDNHSPLHTSRTAQLQLYTTGNSLVTTLSTTLMYQSATSSGAFPKGTFAGTFSVPQTVASGIYFGKIKLPTTLRKQIDAPIQINQNKTTTLADSIPLISGDLHNTNTLDLSSYNEIAENCFYTAQDAKAGNPKCADFTSADLNDDGLIDETDLNLMLRSLSQRTGD